MKPVPHPDGRLAAEISAELRRRAIAFRGGATATQPIGPVENAIYEVAGRIGEEVTTRLDQVPKKQTDNFYTAVGIGRDPALAATMPVAFRLSDTASPYLSAPAGTQIMANPAGQSLIFETDRRIDLLPGGVSVLRAVDCAEDSVFLPAEAVLEMKLPQQEPVQRWLRSEAPSGTGLIQVNPVMGLEKGMWLEIGAGSLARHYRIAKVEGELVSIEPALQTSVEIGARVTEVTDFAPFEAESRDHQKHALYLGHDSLLETSPGVAIDVEGVAVPADAQWSWWGALVEGGTPGWHGFESEVTPFRKSGGKPLKTKVNGTESYWLRAELPDQSLAPIDQRNISIRLTRDQNDDGSASATSITYEAFAATAPVVTENPYHPFGTIPRQLDTFHIGCKEAFAKAGAAVDLDFRLGGADFGPIAIVPTANPAPRGAEVFAVGSDSLLYRVQLSNTLQTLLPVPLSAGQAILGQAMVAISLGGAMLHVAAAGAESIEIAMLEMGAPLTPDKVKWQSIPLPVGIEGGVDRIVAFEQDIGVGFYVLTDRKVYRCAPRGQEFAFEGVDRFPGTPVLALIGADSRNGILAVTEADDQGKDLIWKFRTQAGKVELEFSHEELTKLSLDNLACWWGGWHSGAEFADDGVADGLFLAGYQDDELALFRIEPTSGESWQGTVTKFEVNNPQNLQPEPAALTFYTANGSAPLLLIAHFEPVVASPNLTDGAVANYSLTALPPSIGTKADPSRRFEWISGWLAVIHQDNGILVKHSDSEVPNQPWQHIGQDAPANPALAWEYWNGAGWLALDGSGIADTTANLQTSGTISFTVPADLAESDISGRTNYWIRARLIGGDYGEPRITVISNTNKEGVTEQSSKRDLSGIKAPYIVKLDISYSFSSPAPPQHVYTLDSLGFIDRSIANSAGFKFPAFVPVLDIMNPPDREAESAARKKDEERCEDPCEEASETEADPCATPGAFHDCNSTCMDEDGRLPPASGEVAAVGRAILIGFDKPFSGDGIALYISAAPSGQPAQLQAEILQDGQFRPVRILSDHSYGLSESGILTLSLPVEPDLFTMLGATSHWLRLSPKGSSNWSPRIYGVALNAALCRSVETRRMERLGASSALGGQIFRLPEGPIDPATLVLRVQETLSQAERDSINPVSYPKGPAGEWVQWTRVDSLSPKDALGREFLFNAENGEIRFGDGRNGRIPPLGSEIMAESYARITGLVANGIAPGSKPSLASSIAGIDTILALDFSAGGSDLEDELEARKRAAAKTRHGGRLITLADLGEYVHSLSPDIAQVSVYRLRGETRIVVVLEGAEPRPTPARLRAIKAIVQSISSYGVGRVGGLNIVQPRLMPFGVRLIVDMAEPTLLAEATSQVKALLTGFFDSRSGGYEQAGWPTGRLPTAEDIAAALVPMAHIAFPFSVTLRRTDRPTGVGDELPASLPRDVLARFDGTHLTVDLQAEGAK